MSNKPNRRNRGFDWYSLHQRFSIRKYHFGAASVLLGVAIASLATGPLAQAEEIDLSTQPAVEVPVPETPPAELPVEVPEVPVVESLPSPEPEAPVLEAPVAAAEVVPEVTAEPVAPETPAAPEVEAPVERQAGIVYHASYVEETTKEVVGKGKPQATIVATTEEKASAEVTVSADYLPKGYELSDPAKTSVTATVHEGQANPVAFSVRPVAVPETKVVTEGYTGFRATVPPAADGQVDQPTDGADAKTYEGAEHFKNFDAADMAKIKRQITWLDFGDSTAWTGLEMIGSDPALRVGARYRKEISPGYVVEITVSELKPFESTDVYRDRVKGTDKEWTYNPNAVNSNMKTYVNGKTDYGNSARIIAAPQDRYSNAKVQGFDVPGLVTLRSIENFGNVGVKFTTKATYLGNVVPLNVVFMSGEEARDSEFETYTTNGEAFELFGETSNSNTVSSYKVLDNWLEYNGQDHSGNSADWKARFDGRYWANIATEDSLKTAKQSAFYRNGQPTKVVDGIGTKVFGPVSNHLDSGFSTPIIMTKNASEVGMYIMSTGRQSAMIGVALLDYGDAPESYGSGAHSISLSAAEKQPYLGTVMGDVDFIPEGIPPGSVPWYRDELINQFDEGPAQLMGDDVEAGTNYTLHHADDGSYELKFIANTNGHAEAYVQGWIDFNNDGKFDDSENSGLIRIVNGKEKYTLNFNDIYQNVDPVVTKLGVRMRIALDAVDIITPDLTAYSGEVEDFQIQMTHPPRGSLTESRGEQGQTQTGVVNFFAYGENRYSTTPAKIDQSVAPQIVKADGTLVADTDLDPNGYYVVAGEGKYKLTGAGDNVSVEFIPEAGFITEYADGSKIGPDGNPLKVAKGISIRRSSTVKDAHDVAYTTGWHAKTEQNNLENVSPDVTLAGQPAGTMDGRFVPHVVAVRPTATPAVSTGVQGAIQTGTPIFTSGDENVKMGHTPEGGGIYPIKLIDETNTEADTAKAYAIVDGAKTEVGTYTVDGSTGTVTFTPNDAGKKYIGVVDPATVIAKDTNGSSVSTTYTPTITPITPTAQAATTVNLQGKTQEATVTFTADNANSTVSFAKSAAVPADQSTVGDLLPDTVTLLDENGNKVDKVEGPDGTYELVKTADAITITFTPKPDFIGTATPVRVQVEDSNGTAVETRYTPVVVQVRPTAEQDETYAVKNTPQTSTTDFFKPGQLDLNGDGAYDSVKETVALDPSTLKLIDGGQEVTSLTIDGQGTYTLNPDGSVTFTPVTDYVGDVTPVTIRIKDVNGTPVETTYTPHIIDVPEKELTTTVKRTINYVYADNSPVTVDKDDAPVAPLEHTVSFTRTAIADPETGEISYTEWTPVGDTTTFPEVTSPLLNNFTPDKAVVPADTTVSGDDADETITVIYRENDKQMATITYKAKVGTETVELSKEGAEGHPDDAIDFPNSPQKIADFEKLGYMVESNAFADATDPTFDDQPGVQNFDVILIPKTTTIKPQDPSDPDNPTNPKPGDPVDPTNPDGPVWEEVTKTITRTVAYKLDTVDGQPAPTTETKTNSVTFERTGSYNHVTKQVTYTDWVAKDGDSTLEGQTLPLVTGYVAVTATRNSQAVSPSATAEAIEASATTDNVDEIVVYKALSSWTITPPPGTDPVPPIPYGNHPTDPTKPADPTPTPAIPKVDGYVPVGPDGNELPKDPDGNYIPPVPTDPTQPTVITYKALEQKAVIQYLEEGSNKVLSPADEVTGLADQPIVYSTADTIALIKERGYELVQDNFPRNATYDRDSSSPQVYTVVFREKVVTTTPDNPQTPGTPVDPTNPNGPRWEEVTKTITRTVAYKLDTVDGQPVPNTESKTNSVTFERTGSYNHVTKQVTYTEWTAKDGDSTLEGQALPLVTGYVATTATRNGQPVTPGATAEVIEATATTDNVDEIVVYKALGSWTITPPPGTDPVPPIPYPNHPTDPTKPGDPTPTPAIPKVDGYVPVGPDGNELPKDPDGNYIPPVPTDPTQPTVITYKALEQKAVIKYLEEGSNNVLSPADEVTGLADQPIVYSTADTIALIKERGYELVQDNFPTNATFDRDTTSPQVYTVVFREKVVTTTPDNPQTPGTPVDPNNPDGPKWEDVSRTITRKVSYVVESPEGETVTAPEGKTTTVTFERTGSYNFVTKQVAYTDWEAKDGDAVLEGNPLPVIDGYVAIAATKNGDKVEAITTAEDVTATETTTDISEVVTYKKLSSWTVTPPPGNDPVPDIPYENDPNDPTKPADPKPTRPNEEDPNNPIPTVPDYPGYVPVDPDGNELPKDPGTDQYIPPKPTDPTKPTVITYKPVAQKASITFVNKTNPVAPVELTTIPLTGKSGDQFGYDPTPLVKAYEMAGYVVTNENDYAATKTYSDDPEHHDSFVFSIVEKTATIVPEDPNSPDDPNNPNPGDPVDPNNPDGPKWEDVSRTITRKVSYVVESPEGETVTAPEGKTTTVTFERTGSYNFVTKQVTYTDWEAKDGDAVLEGNPLPVIDGYVAIAATKNGDKVEASTTAEDVTATETTTDISEVVTYKKLSSWTVTPPPGNDPVPDIPYENDPNDPTKPADPKPTRPNEEDPNNPIPTVPDYPGYVPVDPDGNELPKDPDGNYIPPKPKDPSQPTLITYKPVEQVGKISFVDVTVPENPVTKVTIDLSGKTGDKLGMDVSSIVTMYENLGYTVTNKDNYDKDGTFGPDLKSNTFVYELVERTVDIDPDDPNTPTPKPGEPVDPNNPDGPKWPDSVRDLVTTEEVTRTISYVDTKGNTVFEEIKETKTFKRTAKVNIVTGAITYGDWSADQTFEKVTSPLKDNHLVDKLEVPASTVKAEDEDINEVVTYTLLGQWKPVVPPGTKPVPPVTYPRDPEDPTKPGTEVPTIPAIPGTIPVYPDPNNPGQTIPLEPSPDGGYELPPVPSKPGEDTVIEYVPNTVSLTVKYVDDTGADLRPTESKEVKVGDDYTTTPQVIEGYYLTEIPANSKGKVGAEGTTVVYVYNKLGSWVPELPEGHDPVPPIPYPNHPTDPGKPGIPTGVVPVVPGYIPVGPDGKELPKGPDGNYLPPVPSKPGEDTVIKYIPQDASVTVRYVDDKGNDLIPSKSIPGKVGDDYTTTPEIIKGYLLKEVPSNASGKIPAGGTSVVYTYVPIGSYVPNIPGQPSTPIPYPNHPTDPGKPGTDLPSIPHVPGYIPVGPGGVPLQPVDPSDPTKGYIAPPIPGNPGQDTPINYIPSPPARPSRPIVVTPVKPETPVEPEVPTTPAQPSPAGPAQPASPGTAQLPNTGTSDSHAVTVIGASLFLAALAIAGTARRREE
ncbi:mucin-binding protein [Streptococcus suis]|uniref:mucin-binding protein n=5 Tax=Streptococcus suis TaxID=1307 RepID=UPI000CF47D31|nr:MucBP domain-containing protein [Streptococcus suis]